MQPDYLSNLRAQQIAANSLLQSFTPYEGKFVRKLAPATRQQLNEALAQATAGSAYRAFAGDVQAYSSTGAPFVNCGKLVANIQRIDDDIKAIEALQTLPETAAYLESLADFTIAYGNLAQAIAETDAPAHWRRLLKVPSFPA